MRLVAHLLPLSPCRVALAGACLIASAISLGAATASVRPPNVLFIVADDLNNALGCYGDPVVRSPHIDALAARGVRFDRAYNQGPICIPSRASFLTGLRCETTQVYRAGDTLRGRMPSVVTLPEYLRARGYYTARVGKIFHMGVPHDIGTSGKDDPQSWDHVVNPKGRDVTEAAKIQPVRKGTPLVAWAAPVPGKELTDGIVATETIKLLERQKGSNRPFFIGAGFFLPHLPWVAPTEHFAQYPLATVPLPHASTQARDGIPKAALTVEPPNYGMDTEEIRRARQAYYASVSYMDQQVGRVLAALDRYGLAENTIVVFLGDHGYHLGEHGFWLKHSLFEESTRTPLIVAAPRVKPGVARGLVEFIDIYPTLLELTGTPPNPHLEGRSFAPMLRDADAPGKPAVYTAVMNAERQIGRAVRTDRWRYIEWDEGKAGVQLYDEHADPREVRNLAMKSELAATRAELSALLRAETRRALSHRAELGFPHVDPRERARKQPAKKK